MLRESEIL